VANDSAPSDELTLMKALLVLIALPGSVGQVGPALCPPDLLTTCHSKMEKCTGAWHGIDSLDLTNLSKINDTHVKILSLSDPPVFEPTVGTVHVRALDGGPADPNYCVKAPPASTQYGNCTTHLTAFFSDANATLETATMESCGILSWKPILRPIHHLYGQWVHADLPKRSPGTMCDWQPGFNLYKEVGTYPPNTRYFTIENVKDDKGNIDQFSVKIHSVNGSFPDQTVKVNEVGAGTPGKMAFRAKLFDGSQYHGIMRTNSAGGPACCEIKGNPFSPLSLCPVVSWWNVDGNTSCWSPVNVPSENVGACTE